MWPDPVDHSMDNYSRLVRPRKSISSRCVPNRWDSDAKCRRKIQLFSDIQRNCCELWRRGVLLDWQSHQHRLWMKTKSWTFQQCANDPCRLRRPQPPAVQGWNIDSAGFCDKWNMWTGEEDREKTNNLQFQHVFNWFSWSSSFWLLQFVKLANS